MFALKILRLYITYVLMHAEQDIHPCLSFVWNYWVHEPVLRR
jgi:hypothetical protein